MCPWPNFLSILDLFFIFRLQKGAIMDNDEDGKELADILVFLPRCRKSQVGAYQMQPKHVTAHASILDRHLLMPLTLIKKYSTIKYVELKYAECFY